MTEAEERKAFEHWYATSEARWWNMSDAMFAAWCAALTAQANKLGFLRQISEQQMYEISQQAAEIEALRAEANAALNLWPRDCRLCANYTTASGGCTSAVRCVDSDQFQATTPRQYWEAVTP